MTDIEQASADARAIAEEKSKQGTFSFLDRLNNRNYPTEDVEIYLDEAAGYVIQKLTESLEGKEPKQAELIEKQIEFQREKARESRYVVHMQGISVESYDETVDKSQEQYPLEYREFRNPLTAKLEREVIENDDRELYFRTHLWAKYITSIEDSEGSVDSNITPEFMGIFMGHAPIAAQVAVGDAVQKLRMITAWMDEIQGEDFLAKS